MDDDSRRDFEEFVAARSAALFRTAMALTGHRQEAEDLLQSALASALRRWGSIRSAPEAYLRRTMYHQYVSWWRRRRRRPEVVTGVVPESGSALGNGSGPDQIWRVETRIALREVLAVLPPKQRAVLALRYFEDLPDRRIAELLGCRESTVRSQAARALDRIRRCLGNTENLTLQEAAR